MDELLNADDIGEAPQDDFEEEGTGAEAQEDAEQYDGTYNYGETETGDATHTGFRAPEEPEEYAEKVSKRIQADVRCVIFVQVPFASLIPSCFFDNHTAVPR